MKKINTNTRGLDASSLLLRLLNEYKRGFVAEELIHQAPEMSILHPQSVNTMRICTINYGDKVELIHSYLKCGTGGAIVDACGVSRISCGVDLSSGKVISAKDGFGAECTEHPDTSIKLIGFEIPRWEEVKTLAKKVAQVIPDNRFTGWDFALTPSGWVMVEGNDRASFNFQLVENKGARKEMDEIMDKLGIKIRR